jgi:hypothetical protein
VRDILHQDRSVYELANRLRSLARVRVGDWGGPTEMEIRVRRLEWFDDGDEINQQHLPLELGDIFEIASKPNKLFILVAPPCDLMMRQDGKRHHTVENGLLLEATPVEVSKRATEKLPIQIDEKQAIQNGAKATEQTKEPEQEGRSDTDTESTAEATEVDSKAGKRNPEQPGKNGNTEEEKDSEDELSFKFRLEFYEHERDWDVNLRKMHYINLDVLDLCVFRDDGTASISAGDEPAILMSESWRARFPRVQKKFGKACRRYADLMRIKGMKQSDALKLALNVSLGNLLEAQARDTSIGYDIKRVGRLKQPRAGALLARFAHSISRDAFEHDLVRRPKILATTEENPSTGTAEQINGEARARL